MANYKSAISFGLVHIPVSLEPVIKNNDTSFNQLHKKCKHRISYIKYCPYCKKDVEQKDLVKAYEYTKDNYVEFTKEDFEKIKTEEDKTLEIISFVKISEIDPIYLEKSYYLETDKKNKAYTLFKKALEKEKKVAIAKTILGNKTYYGMIRFSDKAIIFTTFYFEEEIKNSDIIEDYTYSEKELNLAIELIKSMTDKFKPETFKDDYQDKIKDAIEKKINGEKIKTSKSKKKESISDLMEALEKSIRKKKHA